MRYIGIIFAICLSIQTIASNTITLSSVSGTPQTEVEVVVSLNNTDAITALELNIPLGEYLSYVNGSAALIAARSNGHLISAAQVGQELRIYVYSFSLAALQGNTGELLSFRLKLGNEPATYALTPSIVMSNAQGTSLEASAQAGAVTILAPKLQILTEQIDFGHIPIRATYSQDLQLYNAGTLPLIIENVVVNDPAFSPAQTALTIETGEVAYTTIHYTPTVRGAIQKEVLVTSNAINGGQVVAIVADPFSVNELHVGSASGIADSIVTVALTMNNMEPIVAMQCAFVLPEQLEYVANSLQPNAVRTNGHQVLSTLRSDTLFLAIFSMNNQSLHANDGEIATFQIRLNGNSGVYGLYPQDVVLSNITEENMVSATYEGWVNIQSPSLYGDDYLSFGDCPITETAIATYSFNNYGNAPLQIERVTFLAEGYRVVTPLPVVVNPWEEGILQIAYEPKSEGDFSTTMNLYTNDPTTRMKAVAVSGHLYEPNTLTIEGKETSDGKYQLAISLDNYTDIVALQYDIHWRSDMTTSQAAFTPTARLQNHSYSIVRMDVDTYRVLIYSLVNSPIIGSSGELHQLIFTPQGEANYCDNVITIDNIVLSNSNGTDKVSESAISYYTPSTQYVEEMQTAYNQYIWHNRIYKESGTYIDTLQTINGCDSVVTLHLTINIYIEENVTACDNYTWHGMVYTESGDYEYRTTLENSCERIEVLHLTINRSEREEYWETACDAYEWHGHLYSESGVYEYRTTTEQGCERVEVLYLTINYSEYAEYSVTACDQYVWHGNTYTEGGVYEYRISNAETEKLYVGYNSQSDPIIGLTPPRGISRFIVDGYITEGSGCCFVGTGSPENGIVNDEGDLRIFDAGCFYYDRMSGRHDCFFDDFRYPFNIEFGNYYAKNLETGAYYFNEGNNVYEYSNTEYPLTLFYKDYGKIHKVQFFDNNNLLWADINAVLEDGVPMITIDYYNPDGTIYYTQQFTENLHAETKTICSCGRVEILHLTINNTQYAEETVTACDNYTWNGETYTESGEYTYTTTAANGCDSIVTLHLTINNSEIGAIEYATICYGETYTWNDQTYAATGEYSVTLTNAAGCDSIATLHLTIMPEAVTSTETVVIGSDDLPYTWRGNTYLATGRYTDIEQYTQVDCDSAIHVLDLTVLTTGNFDEESITICETETPYMWYGESYTATGKYTYTEKYAGTDIDSVQHILNLTVNPTQYTEETVVACDSYTWNGETYTTSGEYVYTTTAANGCDSIVTLHLTVNHTQYTEESVTACDSYTWNGETYSKSGEYTYTTVAANGCDSVVTLHLTILPDAVTETEELVLCSSELPYEWYGELITEAGFYTVAEQYAVGCDSVVHELRLNVYVQTLPEQVTLPIVRIGEAIDVTVPSAEIYAHIASDSWYAPNALVEWYTLEDVEWIVLTTDPVPADIDQITLKYAVDTDCGSVESDEMVISLETTNVENSQSGNIDTYKIFRDGQLLIIRDGKTYNAQGAAL